MKRILSIFILSLLACACAHVRAERNLGFGASAFNHVTTMTNESTLVFSPFSYELDCVVFAEAAETIAKANIAEAMGVLTDFEGVYAPPRDYFAEVAATNGFEFLAARGFCLPTIDMARAAYRTRIWEMVGAGVMFEFPVEGAEAWFKASMNGRHEDFRLPVHVGGFTERYLYYDLVSVRTEWLVPFPEAGEREFTCADDSRIVVPFIRSRQKIGYSRDVDQWLLRIPLRDDAYLFLLVPDAGHPLSEARMQFIPERIDSTVLAPESLTLPDAGEAMVELEIPRLDLRTENDFSKALVAAKVPQGGFFELDSKLTRRDVGQVVRFEAANPREGYVPAKDADEAEGRTVKDLGTITVDRPFFFFVLHRPTASIPVCGQFTGK